MQEHLFPHKLRHFYHGWGRRCQEIDLNIHNNRYRNIHENENINPGRKLQFTPRTLKRFDTALHHRKCNSNGTWLQK